MSRCVPLLLGAAAACVAHAAPNDAPPPPRLVAPTAAGATNPVAPAAAASAPAPRTVAAAASGAPSTEPRTAGEPEVRHILVEDDHTRVEELRVRGVPQRIVVTSKVGGRSTSYEIITGDGSRDLSPGANTSRGATGQRVWRVLDF